MRLSKGNIMIKKIFAGFLLALGLSTAAMADNALVIGDYNNAPDSVKARLEAAGHTVTIQRDQNAPGDISAYDQIWDLRWMNAFDQATIDKYDDFVKNGGFLFIATENPGCCTSQNATKAALITQMGGGETVIGGDAGSTENQVVNGTNTTYMTSGLTVNFSAISAIENTQGTALITDANGKVAAMMWVGNAGDLGTGYTGTVITIADINWLAQGFTNVDQVADNTQALDDIIRGVVAGTVAGTISDTGNGEGSDVGGGGDTPTLTSSVDGDPIVTTTSADGGTLTQIITDYDVAETSTEQTVVKTVTTNVTRATVTTTCTTPTTVNTYSDNRIETVNGTETCSNSTAYNTTSSDEVDQFTGRIDQMSSIQDVTSANIRGLQFSGIQAITSNHSYSNGLNGTTHGFSIGGTADANDAGYMIGGGFAQMNTNTNDSNNNSAKASTSVLQGSIAKDFEKGEVKLSIQHAMSDYSINRHIGDWTNSGNTSGTDTSAGITFMPKVESKNVQPIIGYTRGQRSMDAYSERGSALTARNVPELNETYSYGIVGATANFGIIDLTGMHYTDGVNQASIGIGNETDKLKWGVRVNRTMTNLGTSDSISARLNWKF